MSEASIVSGTMVGEYRIVEQIGDGGMGVVYLAVHPVIDKRVAVKVLRHEVAADEELVSRFVTEARAVNAIEHQNIIDVFAFGRLPDGRAYYIMEYLRGHSLEELLECDEELPPEDIINILKQVADAVDAAHERHIIHRDLKPDNIYLVPRRSGETRAVVLDFGIAKLGHGPHRTRSGLVMGTPLYMSPEQCRGIELDHRTDVYALGTIAYRMLAGRLPFEADSVQVVMYQQISRAPTPPSDFGALPSVDGVLMKALAKDPQYRFHSMSELVDALEQALLYPDAQPLPHVGVVQHEVDAWCEITKPVDMGEVRAKGKDRNRRSSSGGTTAAMMAMSPIRLEGHKQPVQRVAYCPAGGLLASAGDDQTVRLWSYDGGELAVFDGHKAKVEQLAFSPLGHLLASTGGDGRILVWSIYGGDCLRELRGHMGRINSMAFSPDGDQLVTGGVDGSVRVWTVGSGTGQLLSGHTGPVRAVAFSPIGNAVASASDDRSVRLWKDGDGKRNVLTGHRRAVYSVAFSPDGQFLASGGHDGLVQVWRVQDGSSRTLIGHHGIVWHVAYSPNGEYLASSSSDATVRLWKKDGSSIVLEGHEKKVRESVFSPDGDTLATVSIDGTIRLWDTRSGECRSILSHTCPARSVAFTPRGDWLASASGRQSLVMTPVTPADIAAKL